MKSLDVSCIAAEQNGKHAENGQAGEPEAGSEDAEAVGKKKKKNKKGKGTFL